MITDDAVTAVEVCVCVWMLTLITRWRCWVAHLDSERQRLLISLPVTLATMLLRWMPG